MESNFTRNAVIIGVCALLLGAYAFVGREHPPVNNDAKANGVRELDETATTPGLEHATFALGCFWHSEEMFLELKGVENALPGYCGGTEKDPDYETVGSGSTGYAESVDVTFDPKVISYRQLLEVFFAEHDPTMLNQQGPDVGSQYRSAVFYRNADQKKAIEEYLASLKQSHKYSKPIVTEVSPYRKFYRAEDYHLRYVQKHPDESYVAHVTIPELQQFRHDFPQLLKK